MASAIVGTPFPADKPLKYSLVGGKIIVHHPDNEKVTKIAKPMNIKRAEFLGIDLVQVFKAYEASIV